VHATADVLPCPGGSLRAPWLLVGHCGITMTNAPEQHPEVDVLLTGTVFFDLIFTGFPHPPLPGTEVWTAGMGSSPGGIANLAVACARLGLSTSLAAGFGDDLYGDWMWSVLRDQERVELS